MNDIFFCLELLNSIFQNVSNFNHSRHHSCVPPHDLSLPLLDAIKRQIEKLFLNKVIKDLGVVVTIYDIKSLEGGFVFPGDGAPTYTVEFRLVVFKPFVGEILVGKLKKCDKTGLHLSLGFFEDVHVPEHLLQHPSKFDEEEKLWVWSYQDTDMFMDLDEEVRFRVEQIKYPPIPIEQESNAKLFAPMEIHGLINADGLELVSWWS